MKKSFKSFNEKHYTLFFIDFLLGFPALKTALVVLNALGCLTDFLLELTLPVGYFIGELSVLGS